jgi:uncharacterized membrane protein
MHRTPCQYWNPYDNGRMSLKKHAHPLIPREEKLTSEVLNEHFHSSLHFDRTWSDIFADFVTQYFGTVFFLLLNATFFVIWILLNLGTFGSTPFDPFPYGLLTMLVSLEAIFLSITVLISQNRQSRVADIRQQMDFEIDVRSEEEITKMLHVLDDLRKASGIAKPDPELDLMKLRIDLAEIQKQAERNN